MESEEYYLIGVYRGLVRVSGFKYYDGIFAAEDSDDRFVELIFKYGGDYFTYTFDYNKTKDTDEVHFGGTNAFMPINTYRAISTFIDAIFIKREDEETMRKFIKYLEEEKETCSYIR